MYVMLMAIQKQEKIPIYFKKQAQIGALLFNKTFFEVLAKYSNYNNIFSAKNIVKLSKNTKINKHAIKLEKSKQLLFNLIYSLKKVKLETLKTYIKINLTSSFIWPFESPTKVPILFNKKSNKNLCFYMDY